MDHRKVVVEGHILITNRSLLFRIAFTCDVKSTDLHVVREVRIVTGAVEDQV